MRLIRLKLSAPMEAYKAYMVRWGLWVAAGMAEGLTCASQLARLAGKPVGRAVMSRDFDDRSISRKHMI
jgi:hypothetical protein